MILETKHWTYHIKADADVDDGCIRYTKNRKRTEDPNTATYCPVDAPIVIK